MKTNKRSYGIAMAILGISILACNLGTGSTPSDTLAPDGSSVPSSNSNSASACFNSLLPIKAGATWAYKITGPAPDTFTRTVLAVDASGFTDQDVFGSGVTRQSQWKCENGNLIALNPGNGNSSSVNAENISANFQTTELSGVTIPATMNAGDTWTQSITLEGTQTINGEEVPVKNQTSSTCTAIGNESVTVEAGTFDAMRFDCQTSMNIVMTMQGTEIPVSLNLNSSNWHAENIGLIKTAATGEGLDSIIELVSYIIP